MNNSSQHQQIRYQKINIQPAGLLPVHFNQLNSHNITWKKIDQTIDKLAEPQQNNQDHKSGIARGFVGPRENSIGIPNIDFSQANVHDPSAFLSKSSVTQNTENVPFKTVKESSNISSDSLLRNRSSWRRGSKEPRLNYRDNKQDNPNFNDELLWKKMPALPPFTGPLQNKSIQTKSKETLSTKTRVSFNTTNNTNYENGKVVDWKNIKTIQNDNEILLTESRVVEECKTDEKSFDELEQKWNGFESPTKEFLNPENHLENSRSTRNESTTHNSLMFDSGIMSIGEYEENQQVDFRKKESKAEVETKVCAGVSKEELDKETKSTICNLEALLDEERAKNKEKSDEMVEIKKELKELNTKYELLLSCQEKELNKQLEKSLQQLKCEQDRNIEMMIQNINENSSRQLNNIVARFQESIRIIQEEYNNYKHTAEEEKHILNTTNAHTSEKLILDLKGEIERLHKKNEVIDRELQTDMNEGLIGKLDTEEEKQSVFVKIDKQNRLIEKLERKIKEYKSEYERIFYKSEDYRNYIKELEFIISDLTKDIHTLERQVRNYAKNEDIFTNVIEELSDNLMSVHLCKLNKKYEQACEQELSE